MKLLTIEKISKMEEKEFDKLYCKKLEEMEKSFDREEYCCEEKSDVLELLKLKIEKFNNFLKEYEIESWPDFNNILEDRIAELLKIYEMYLLANENHLRGVRLLGKFLEESFKVCIN